MTDMKKDVKVPTVKQFLQKLGIFTSPALQKLVKPLMTEWEAITAACVLTSQ